MQFEGKVAFITGAARGQGRAHALRLARDGADIVGVDICQQIDSVGYPMSTTEDLDETVRLVEKLGRKMIGRVADVRDADTLTAAYDEGRKEFGRINFVVANAGICPTWGPSSETMQAWQDCMDVNLNGVLNTLEVVWPRLLDQGTGGSIVVTGSMAGVQPMMRTLGGRNLGLLGYCASKAALVNVARNYASMLAYHNIRVNIVHPTGVNTPMLDNDITRARFEHTNEEDLKALVSAMQIEVVEAEDIANTVAWLCSEESRYFTGGAMQIDAGANLR